MLSNLRATLRSDLHFNYRRLMRTPGFTLSTIALLALAIGATLAAYSTVYRTLLQPLPLADADRIVQIKTTEGTRAAQNAISPALFLQLLDSPAIDAAAAVMPGDVNLTLGDGLPRRSNGLRVSQDFLRVFSLSPILGRVFDTTEHQGAAVALLSESFWRTQLNGERNVIGSQIALNGVEHEVVGVLPATMNTLVPGIDLIVPMELRADQANNRTPYLGAFAKLPPGPTRSSDFERLAQNYNNTDAPFNIELSSLRSLISADSANRNLLLLGGVVLALLVACFNVGNLVLARALASVRDLDIRRVLGASNARLLRSAITEAVLLVGSACALGLGLATAFKRLLAAIEPASTATAAIQTQTLFDLAKETALPVAILFPLLTLSVGVLPALATLRDSRGTLSRSGLGKTSGRLRRTLTGAEVAITVVLVVAAATLLRSLLAASAVDPGFDATDAVTAQFSLPAADYPDFDAARRGFLQIVEQAQQAPEIGQAAALTSVPLSGSSGGANFTLVGGKGETANAQLRIMTSNAVDTLGLRLLAGRDFATQDREGSQDVVIINQSFATELSQQLTDGAGSEGLQALLGRQVRSGNRAFQDASGVARNFNIVGVVQDVRGGGLLTPTRPEVTFPLSQAPAEPFSWTGNSMVLAAIPSSTAIDDNAAALALRRAAAQVDPNLPLFDIASLGQRLSASLTRQRFAAKVVSGLGLATLALAAAGIYALGAFFAATRRAEVGLRLALGATNARLVKELLAASLSPALFGLGIGLAGAVGLLALVSSALPEIDPFHLGSLVGAVTILSGVALLAGWLPSRGLSKIEPADVLRSD